MKKYFKWIVLCICLIVFIVISFMVYTGKDIYIDGYFYNFIDKYFIKDSVTPFVKGITLFGDALCIIIICIISIFVFRNKKINICIVSNLVIVTILNGLLKVLFMRERPTINQMITENSYSFPSGHSMISMAFYGYLIYLIYNYINNKIVRYLFIILLSILIFLIGISRIYLGVHYASDVIGGFCFGIVYIFIFIEVSKKVIKKI